MRILALDTLIQTIDFDKPVRGGLVKAANQNVIALSERHDVYYAYFGKPTKKFKFHPIILGEQGAKDWCLQNKKKTSLAHHKLKKDIPLYINVISDINPDVLIINVESKSQYLIEIAKKFVDIPKIFIFFDGVSNNDLFGTAGIIGTIIKLRKYNSFITTISEFTRDTITKVLIDREPDLRRYYGFMEEVDDVHSYKLFDEVCDHFVYYDNFAKIEIVQNKDFSVNIGRYQRKKGVLDLLYMHKFNKHKVKLYGIQDPVWDEGLEAYNKIKDMEEKYDNYIVCEGWSDEKLREDAKYGMNNVISCPVEGFGYTAFEMGVYGMPSVILRHGERHATEEYLKKVGAHYVSIDKKDNKKWKQELYRAMKNTKLSEAEKKINAQKFLDYFTIDNYNDEWDHFIKLAQEKVKQNKKGLF